MQAHFIDSKMRFMNVKLRMQLFFSVSFQVLPDADHLRDALSRKKPVTADGSVKSNPRKEY
jgi:hypothetical protein